MIERNDPDLLEKYRDQTVLIDTDPIGTIDFDLDDVEKDFLVLQGRVAALKLLAVQKLLKEDELVIGIEMWSGEVHENFQNAPVYVSVLVSSGGRYDTIHEEVISGQPVHVRKIRLEMHLNEFFGLFKRFAIAISGFDLTDREIAFDD